VTLAPPARGARRALILPALSLAVAVVLAACGGGQVTGPTARPGSPSPATAEPGATDGPTVSPSGEEPSPSVDPGAQPGQTPTPGSTQAPPATAPPSTPGELAAACTGNDENRSFYAGVAEAVAWDVYCPVLPAGWFVDTGSFRLANGGRLEIAYKGPAGARLELREGAYCAANDDCVPDAPDAGPAVFGDRPARLLDGGDGRWLVVAEDGSVNWEVRSIALDRATALAYAAAFARVGG
jgi:hypothetical protein